VHVFYAMAVLGSALAVFGAAGLVVSVVTLLFWGSVFGSPSRPSAFLAGCLLVACGCCLLSPLLLPSLSHPEATRRSICQSNLRLISLGVQNYRDCHKTFPPAFIPDEQGKPKHSWRVLILPFIEEKALYDAYDFGEPWDGPNNSKLIAQMPGAYACPDDTRFPRGTPTYTNYVAVVGPRTMWPGPQGRRLIEITDGTSHTVQVLEDNSLTIPWTEPRDLALEEALGLLTAPAPTAGGPHRHEGYFYQYYHGRHVSLPDGSIVFLPYGVDRGTWLALLTINDGSRDDPDVWGRRAFRPQIKLGNCYRLAVLLILTLLPLPWVFIPRSPPPQPSNYTSGRSAEKDGDA
jgi:hypothetical protein